MEGAAVMATELIGAKLLAPYFGTSIYVWAAVLGVTLGGLMCGYFAGGFLSKNNPNNIKSLLLVLLLGGFFLLLMPFSSAWIMAHCLHLSLQMGSILSLLFFLFPPLICFGSTSPLIINLISALNNGNNAGESAGTIYAVSTLGGIIGTFLLGFYLIPEWGLKIPAFMFSGALMAAALPLLPQIKQRLAGAVVVIGVLVGFGYAATHTKSSQKFKVIYESEGILGQLKVIDHSSEWYTQDGRMGRGLLVNNTLQTFMDLSNPDNSSIWAWSSIIPTALSVYPPQSKVLLLGLGGGTIAKQLKRLQFDFEVVEIDARINDVAKNYFFLDKDVKVTIDDARHFLKICNKKYDIVIFDTFLSESAPEHLLTQEAFGDVKNVLNEDGMFIANFYGYLRGNTGKAARSVFRTIETAGFIPKLLATPGAEENRNLLFMGLTKEKDFTQLNYQEPGAESIRDLTPFFVNTDHIRQEDAIILTDASPKLSLLYAKAAMAWKQAYNGYYTAGFIQ
ncbi:MAG: fused MFS/spermidine synthase [Sphingobacteriales bacterium]|nr:fused MFS/spermidine synthase [Sphingobacteriales bacterium]